ncbi:MAG: serine hydrolase [Deltaproteobacteria bacterium]|nr:serine hydrolase [Deltaproteobacteria bacterium]
MKSARLIRRYPFGWLALLFVVCVIPAARSAEDRQLKARIDALAQPLIDNGKIVGLAIGVIRGDETYVLGYGEVAEGSHEKPTGDTIFEIGSISKVFTGLLLADMVEHGLVRLDQSVQSLLPSTVIVPKKGDRSITLLDLVTHTSGLPRVPDNHKPKNRANPYADYTFEQLYEFLSQYSLTREPGAKYEYSNLGMGLLGHALALRAGMNYEELLKRRICEPLGLKETTITLTEEQQKRFAQGYNANGKPTPHWDNPTLAGAGGLRSSVNDLLRFLRKNIDPSGVPLERALRASHVPRFDRPNTPSLAMGWQFSYIGSGYALGHNGSTGGFRSFTVFDTKLKMGVVVLANKADTDTDRLAWQAMGLLSPPVAGIAATMGMEGQDAVYPTILKITPGGPAAKTGISVGDRLIGIEDEEGKFVDFKGKSQREVVVLIRGPAGSTLRLVVEPKGTDERKVYELIREIIEPAAPAPSPKKP